jgi:hypothetical protein
VKRIGSPLQGHCSEQAGEPEEVIGVKVTEEDVVQGEGHAVAHHLSLRPFAAVEEQRFALAFHDDARNTPLDCRPRGRCSEKAHEERHFGGVKLKRVRETAQIAKCDVLSTLRVMQRTSRKQFDKSGKKISGRLLRIGAA